MVRINPVLLRHGTEYFTVIFPRREIGEERAEIGDKEVSYQALGKIF